MAQTALPVLTLLVLALHVLDQLTKFREPLVFVQQTGFTRHHDSNAKLESFAQTVRTMMVKITVCFVMYVLTLALHQQPHRHACLHLLCKMAFALVQALSTKVDLIAIILITVVLGTTIEEITYV